MSAYACRISKENLNVIVSENPHFNLEEFLAWMEDNEGGYFIRDENSIFDCEYLADPIFEEIYVFEPGDENAMFRKIRLLE